MEKGKDIQAQDTHGTHNSHEEKIFTTTFYYQTSSKQRNSVYKTNTKLYSEAVQLDQQLGSHHKPYNLGKEVET